eukprot:403367479
MQPHSINLAIQHQDLQLIDRESQRNSQSNNFQQNLYRSKQFVEGPFVDSINFKPGENLFEELQNERESAFYQEPFNQLIIQPHFRNGQTLKKKDQNSNVMTNQLPVFNQLQSRIHVHDDRVLRDHTGNEMNLPANNFTDKKSYSHPSQESINSNHMEKDFQFWNKKTQEQKLGGFKLQILKNQDQNLDQRYEVFCNGFKLYESLEVDFILQKLGIRSYDVFGVAYCEQSPTWIAVYFKSRNPYDCALKNRYVDFDPLKENFSKTQIVTCTNMSSEEFEVVANKREFEIVREKKLKFKSTFLMCDKDYQDYYRKNKAKIDARIIKRRQNQKTYYEETDEIANLDRGWLGLKGWVSNIMGFFMVSN